MTITLHGIPNCDTVKKARAWLAERGVAYAFRDYKKVPPTGEELSVWVKDAGWEALLNKAGTTFRKLPDAERADLDEAKAIAIMVAHPSTIRRPVVTGAGPLIVGFKPETWADRFA
jgi:Spx/MgsR family transcriptional regulator